MAMRPLVYPAISRPKRLFQTALGAKLEPRRLVRQVECADEAASLIYGANPPHAENVCSCENMATERMAFGNCRVIEIVPRVVREVWSFRRGIFDTERSEARIHGQQMAATVFLLKSLGGGWGT